MVTDWLKKSKTLLFLFLYAIFSFPVFFGVMSNGLDPSWLYLLNKLTEIENMRFGRDMVCTYGMLGFLYGPMNFDTNLLQGMFFYGILWIGQLYAFYHLIIKRNVSNVRIFLVLFLFFLGQPAFFPDIFIEASFIFALLLLWEEKGNWYGIVYFTFSTVVAFFYKFSLAIPIVASIIIFFVSKMIQKDMKYLWRLIIPIILIPICYLIYNPSVLDFIKYIYGSWEVARGFNTAMSTGQNDKYIYWMFVLMILYIIIMFMQLLTQNKENFWIMLCIAPELFMGYKHGYVRADNHVIFSYVEIICMLALLTMKYNVQPCTNNEKKINSIKRGLVIIFITFALLNYNRDIKPLDSMMTRVRSLSSVIYTNTNYQKEAQSYSICGYSNKLTSQIGNASFTTYPWEITAIEKMGEASENYVCLPCFQMYSCYTPYLDTITAELLSNNGPEYILMTFDAIDGRIPLLEAPYVWKAISQNYEYIDMDDETFLLKKLEESNKQQCTSVVYEGTIPKGDTLYINDCSEISIDMELSLWGEIVKILWKIPEVRAKIEYSNGEMVDGRVIVENLTDGILTSCMPTKQQYMQFVAEGVEIPQIVSFSFYGEGLRYYKDEIKYVEYR